jgi:hypothetical protein
MQKKTLVASFAIAVLALAAPALAGPPFLCHPFEIGTSASLPWNERDWLGVRADYDVRRVVADTEALLTPSTPTLVRMETLRRAALYASHDRAVAERLIAVLMARVRAADRAGSPDAMASFDAGYVVEALSEIEQFGHLMSDLAGRERELAGVTRGFDSRALLEQSAALRPRDGSIAFALVLVSPTRDKDARLVQARAGAKDDRLLASNLAKLQLQ